MDTPPHDNIMKKPAFYSWIDHQKAAEAQLGEIARLTGLGQGRMLEINCGEGTYLAHFQKNGWECLGICNNEDQALRVYENYDLLALVGSPQELGIPRASYDLVRLRGDLAMNEDPHQLMNLAFEVTSPTGFVIAETWNQSGWPIRPKHETSQQFTGQQLRELAVEAGLEIGGIIAPELGEPIWTPLMPEMKKPAWWRRSIDKIQGFIDRGSILILFAQRPPLS